jgi:G3E family GTPase
MHPHGENSDPARADTLCEVVLICGFLGAGKTTLLGNILNWPEDLSKTAVIVNEVGEIGVDGDLLRGSKTPVFELANGCICCSMQGVLIRTLKDLVDLFQPSRILIEATGVADPIDVFEILRQPQFRQQLTPVKVVTVIETDFWLGRTDFGTFIDNQIKAADLILLNKVDLLPSETVQSILLEIKKICSSCSVIPTHHCRIDPEILWGLRRSMKIGIKDFYTHAHDSPGSAHDMGFLSFSFEEEAAFREACFRSLMESLPLELYRVKGYALLGAKRFLLNHVGGKTEWIDLEEKGSTRLSFIGWQVNQQEIVDKLKACLD